MSLRTKLIRLAHANPELRPHLLPLLRSSKQAKIAPKKIQWSVNSLKKLPVGSLVATGIHDVGYDWWVILADEQICRVGDQYKARGNQTFSVPFKELIQREKSDITFLVYQGKGKALKSYDRIIQQVM